MLSFYFIFFLHLFIISFSGFFSSSLLAHTYYFLASLYFPRLGAGLLCVSLLCVGLLNIFKTSFVFYEYLTISQDAMHWTILFFWYYKTMGNAVLLHAYTTLEKCLIPFVCASISLFIALQSFPPKHLLETIKACRCVLSSMPSVWFISFCNKTFPVLIISSITWTLFPKEHCFFFPRDMFFLWE